MQIHPFRILSFKTKVTVFTLAIFLASIWSLSIYVSRMLREDMQRLLIEQQLSAVSFIATEINQGMNDRIKALELIAGAIPAEMISNPAALQRFIDQRFVLHSQFNAGVFALDANGVAIADSPVVMARTGQNYKDLESVKAIGKSGKSAIGKPVKSLAATATILDIAAPIRSMDGKIIGFLVGATDLCKPNFLDKIEKNSYGETGAYFLVAPQYRLIVTSSRKSRIMSTLSPPGVIPGIDRISAPGFEGSSMYRNTFGVEVLASTKQIPAAGWIMHTSISVKEAFIPVRAMQRHTLLATALLTILVGLLTWWLLSRQFAPMQAVIQKLSALSETDHLAQALPIARQDEIGNLITAFNRLLERISTREMALHESEERFRALHEASFGGVAIHEKGVILDCNTSLEELTGYSHTELIGMDGLQLIAPAWRKQVMTNILSGTNDSYDVEGVRKDGSIIYISIRGKNIPYKGRIVRVTEFHDITPRKQMEEQVRQLAFHDPLTKLPNRRLLNDRLGLAMANSKRSKHYGALLFLDLDNFKPLNDGYGHEAGDFLLIEAAFRLKSCVRETDTVSRFGGDEFVILIEDLDLEKNRAEARVQLIADKIKQVLAQPYRLLMSQDQPDSLIEHHCTASIGIALFLGDEASKERLLKQSDMAMYKAKGMGRNAIYIVSSDREQNKNHPPLECAQLSWHPSYRSGDPRIDRQHQALLANANQLLTAVLSHQSTGDVSAMIDKLLGDVAQHFKDEENIFTQAGFPEAVAHTHLHQQLLDQGQMLASKYRAGQLSLEELFEFIANEIVALHMLREDKEFFSYLEK